VSAFEIALAAVCLLWAVTAFMTGLKTIALSRPRSGLMRRWGFAFAAGLFLFAAGIGLSPFEHGAVFHWILLVALIAAAFLTFGSVAVAELVLRSKEEPPARDH
jgi:hypothetical protein